MEKTKVIDIFQKPAKMSLVADFKNEASTKKHPEVDGVFILGVFEGIFFVPDGTSVNNRFYPRKFWEEILERPEVQNRLQDRTMFGTIGHEDKYIDDEDLAKGKVSHITTELWVTEDGKGMGRALILGTEAGKNLYCYMKAKAQLKISSRAYGDYIPNQTHEGVPVMDADSYYLEGFDIVSAPGFTETKLFLNESSKKNIDDKLIIDTVTKRRLNMSAKTESSKSLKFLRESNIVLEAKLKAAEEQLGEWKKESEKLYTSYKKYNDLGKIKSIQEKLEKLAKYEAISENPESIKSTLVEATSKLEENEKVFENLKDLQSALDLSESALNAYNEAVGSVKEARFNKIKLERALAAYTKEGTISEVQNMSKKCKVLEESLQKEKMEKDCRKYSLMTGQSLESIQKIFESAKSREDAIALITTLSKNEDTLSKSNERIEAKKQNFKNESLKVFLNKNNKVLESKDAFVDEEVEISKSILKKFMH